MELAEAVHCGLLGLDCLDDGGADGGADGGNDGGDHGGPEARS